MPHLRHGKAIQLEGILPKLVLGGKSKVGGCVRGCGQTARVPTGGEIRGWAVVRGRLSSGHIQVPYGRAGGAAPDAHLRGSNCGEIAMIESRRCGILPRPRARGEQRKSLPPKAALGNLMRLQKTCIVFPVSKPSSSPWMPQPSDGGRQRDSGDSCRGGRGGGDGAEAYGEVE